MQKGSHLVWAWRSILPWRQLGQAAGTGTVGRSARAQAHLRMLNQLLVPSQAPGVVHNLCRVEKLREKWWCRDSGRQEPSAGGQEPSGCLQHRGQAALSPMHPHRSPAGPAEDTTPGSPCWDPPVDPVMQFANSTFPSLKLHPPWSRLRSAFSNLPKPGLWELNL